MTLDQNVGSKVSKNTETMPRIATFWHEGQLRFVDQVCMASSLRNGHDVDLYCNAIPANLPNGVRSLDSRKILDPILMERLHPKYHLEKLPFQAVVSFSDMIRMALFKNNAGFWLDTDTYLFHQSDMTRKSHFLPKTAGASVFQHYTFQQALIFLLTISLFLIAIS